MAYYLGIGKKKKAEEVAGTGTPLGLILWIIFCSSLLCYAAGICRYVNRFPGSDPGCGGIRQDRLSFSIESVFSALVFFLTECWECLKCKIPVQAEGQDRCGSLDRNEKRGTDRPEILLSRSYKKESISLNPQYHYAVSLYALHSRTESDPYGIFRPCSYRTGIIL